MSRRLCTDAYLAALAIANGWRLVSCDRDFERFEGNLLFNPPALVNAICCLWRRRKP